VDTKLPTGSTPRGPGGRAGRPRPRDRPLLPLPDLWPAVSGSHLVPPQPPGGGSTPALSRPASSRPTPRGWGST